MNVYEDFAIDKMNLEELREQMKLLVFLNNLNERIIKEQDELIKLIKKRLKN